MPEDVIPEEGGTVEGWEKGRLVPRRDLGTGIPLSDAGPIPTRPHVTLPALRRDLEVYYVYPEQIERVQAGAHESSEHLGFWTFALGVVASLAGALATAGDEFITKHSTKWGLLVFTSVAVLLWGVSHFAGWLRTRKLVSAIITRIRESQKY